MTPETPRTEAGRRLLDNLYDVAFDDNPDPWDQSGPFLNDKKLATAVLAIEAEAAALASTEEVPTYADIRKAITDAYYDTRNEGGTMEAAADLAATRVTNLLSQRMLPTNGVVVTEADLYYDGVSEKGGIRTREDLGSLVQARLRAVQPCCSQESPHRTVPTITDRARVAAHWFDEATAFPNSWEEKRMDRR